MTVIHCVITKEFSFRGHPERWSNGYNLQTTSTIDAAYLKSVCDALVAMELPIHAFDTKVPYRVAGILGDDALYAEEVTTPPQGTLTGITTIHPETCVLAKSKIGPKRYAFKYYHRAANPASGAGDVMAGTEITRINTQLVKLTNGTLPGSATYCRPNGALLTAPFVCDPYMRTHQLKRRGKRNA
jgi:hypothetical protein